MGRKKTAVPPVSDSTMGGSLEKSKPHHPFMGKPGKRKTGGKRGR